MKIRNFVALISRSPFVKTSNVSALPGTPKSPSGQKCDRGRHSLPSLWPPCLAAALVLIPLWQVGAAPLNVRYIRVDNPSAPGMCFQEIEVMSAGENIVAGKGDWITGSIKIFQDREPKEGERLVDGDKDPTKRGPAFLTDEDAIAGAWFEVDLQAVTPVDQVILYGSSFRQYLDKGLRVLSLLDDKRRVVWSTQWNALAEKDASMRIFDFDLSALRERTPLDGSVAPVGEPLQVPMTWLTQVGEEQRPPDADARMKRFNERFSKEEITRLADEFFRLLEPGVPGLAKARELHAAGQDAEALDVWKHYWFAKMAGTNLKRALPLTPMIYPGEAKDLMNGLYVNINASSPFSETPVLDAKRFTPGCIYWVNIPEGEGKGPALHDAAMMGDVNNIERPLLLRYAETGDAEFIKKWGEIMDDWSMNYFADANASPYNVRNYLGSPNPWEKTMEELSETAVKHPAMIDQIPAATLARMQLACLENYGPGSWRLGRETAFNHNVSNIQTWGLTLPYIDEFRPATRLAVERRQHLERWMTLFTEPDGSMVEIGDEGHMIMPMFLGHDIKQIVETKPAWYTPGWGNRAWSFFDNTYKYLFRHVAPGGYDHRFDHRLYADRLTNLVLPQYLRPRMEPSDFPVRDTIFSIPEARRILDTVFQVSAGVPEIAPNAPAGEKEKHRRDEQNRNDALKVLGDDRPGQPKITSDWMPYTGSYYFRSGWAEGNAFLAMLARNSRGGSEPNWKPATWSYGLVYSHDYGFPLMRAETPLINNLHQNTLGEKITFQPGSKTSSLTYAERDPEPHRWHSSEHFAFGEAVFNGSYQKIDADYTDWLVGPGGGKLKLSEERVENVRANRQVHQLRDSRLFIVTDTTHFKNPGDASQTHAIGLPLTLMLSTLKVGASQPFSDQQFTVDEKQQILTTHNPDGPNVALHQFAPFPLSYQTGNAEKPNFGEFSAELTPNVGIAAQPVTASWETEGDSVVVTLIASSPKDAPSVVKSVEPMNQGRTVAGFHAVLTDGSEIWYQASAGPAMPLSCGPLSMTGESLLVTRNEGKISGIAIGGSGFRTEKTVQKTPGPDFEFSGDPAQPLVFHPIHRPILNVRFIPDRNVFTDKLTVEMTSATPGVEIRYTTDGTQPTRDSTLYAGPINLTESTGFAARAYRLGPDGKPLPAEDFEINGTKFTEPSYGWFYKQALRPAATADKSQLQPGLVCEHLQGNWQRLYNQGHWLPAVKTSIAPREMDLSQVKSDDYYGARFKGYLTIPQDGVYTFHAPPEYVLPDIAASYDLRVYVDDEEWYLTQWWHGHGTWSIPLAKGLHRFEVDFMDARTTPWRKSGLYRFYPRPWVVYQGDPSPLLISGPDLKEQRIPASWLSH